jgi:hypothetical protein
MPSQRRRIQQLRVEKVREEATEKERDEHFNVTRSVIPMKQEWRVKEKTNAPALMASDDDMELLDDDESALNKGGSPPPTAWTSTWCSRCRLSLGVLRRRSLRCVSALRRSFLRSPRSRPST